MAMATLTRRRSRILAVEPDALLSIGRNLVVTIEAQRRLGISTKWCVALVAFLLVLFVPFHERPGSNKLFEQRLCRRLVPCSNAQQGTNEDHENPSHASMPQ